MDSPTAAPTAGWFPDPADSGGERWWSGEAWTEHVRASVPAPAPAEPAPAPVLPAAPAMPAFAPVESAPAAPANPFAPVQAAPAPAAPVAEPTAGDFVLPGNVPGGFAETMARLDAARAASADAPPPPATPPAAAAATPAAAPTAATQAFNATTDPDVASRYRVAVAEPAPAPVVAMDPAQPGWPGMPLPGQGAGPQYGAYAAAPTHPYPTAPGAYAGAVHPGAEGSNKTAWSALGSGAVAVLLSLLLTAFQVIGLWPTLLAIAAIVQGIIGAVHSRRSRVGLWPSILAILLGVVAIVIMVATALSWVLAPRWDEHAAEREMLTSANSHWDLGLVSVDCPADPPTYSGARFSCTAYDGTGRTYPIDVDMGDAGSYSWVITA